MIATGKNSMTSKATLRLPIVFGSDSLYFITIGETLFRPLKAPLLNFKIPVLFEVVPSGNKTIGEYVPVSSISYCLSVITFKAFSNSSLVPPFGI